MSNADVDDEVLSEWSDDWSRAPRDGSPVLLKGHKGQEYRMYWSTSYSVFGLGGCWTDGFCTMGDKIDFTHWAPDSVSEQGGIIICRVFAGDDLEWDDLPPERRKTCMLVAARIADLADARRSPDTPVTVGEEAPEVEHFFLPEDENERPETLALALKLAIERGGQTCPVSDYDIIRAREIITGEVKEIDRLRRELAEARSRTGGREAGLEARIRELEAEVERMTPQFVAYEYLESPAGRLEAEARVAQLETALRQIADLDDVEAALDPSWAIRTAVTALLPSHQQKAGS